MPEDSQSRIEVLRAARQRRPWTETAVAECATDPVSFKSGMSACDACSRPCEREEVCATVVAKSEALFESVSRDQAYHMIENGMRRLRDRDEAALRTADRKRPNTFLRLTRGSRGEQIIESDDTEER